MQPFHDLLRNNPELAIFLTLAIGFYVGRLKIGGFSMGSVVGVLMTGLVIGQLGIPISPAIKSVFFLFFLFAVGYGVGPQFFYGLKREGLWQALFATIVCLACLLTAFLTARFLNLGVGYGTGVFGAAFGVLHSHSQSSPHPFLQKIISRPIDDSQVLRVKGMNGSVGRDLVQLVAEKV